eukprot:9849883-Karenia_brevis.AAC.1
MPRCSPSCIRAFFVSFSDEHAGFVNFWLMQRLWSRSAVTYHNGLLCQNILDQLYYKDVEVFGDDLWTDHSSFTATEPLVIYNYYCHDGPH